MLAKEFEIGKIYKMSEKTAGYFCLAIVEESVKGDWYVLWASWDEENQHWSFCEGCISMMDDDEGHEWVDNVNVVVPKFHEVLFMQALHKASRLIKIYWVNSKGERNVFQHANAIKEDEFFFILDQMGEGFCFDGSFDRNKVIEAMTKYWLEYEPNAYRVKVLLG